MSFTPAICTQCGAKIDIDPQADAGICPFCNTAFVTEKAISLYDVTNNINVTSGGNVINIFYQSNPAYEVNRTNTFETPYQISISREKRFSGCAVVYTFEVDGISYDLKNGSTIKFKTNQKSLCIPVKQWNTLNGKNRDVSYGEFTAKADGKDINIQIAIPPGLFSGSHVSIRIVSTNNSTVKIV